MSGSLVDWEILCVDIIFVIDFLGNEIVGEIVSIDIIYGSVFQFGLFFEVLIFNIIGVQGLVVFGFVKKNQCCYIDSLLVKLDVKLFFLRDMVLCWGKDFMKDFEMNEVIDNYELYVLKLLCDGKVAMIGDYVVDVSVNFDFQINEVVVFLKMDNIGVKIWGQLMIEVVQDNNCEIVIVLDDEVVFVLCVINFILIGDFQIIGSFSIQEGKDFVNIL